MSCFAAAQQISADNFLINLWKYYIKTYGDTTKRENWYAYLEYFYRVLLFTTQSLSSYNFCTSIRWKIQTWTKQNERKKDQEWELICHHLVKINSIFITLIFNYIKFTVKKCSVCQVDKYLLKSVMYT